jgi:TfoX/Sxy family transcriptional regulator of competence genes
MATRASAVEFILERSAGAGAVSAKKMFGEYGIFCDGKMVALVCDDRLFIKSTSAGRAYAGELAEAPPYPGAKPCLLVPGEKWDNAEWLATLMRISAAELPVPKPRKKKSP